MTSGRSVYFENLEKANFDDQFTLLYESDTLQLMHFGNTNEYQIVTIATLFKTLSETPLNLHERDSTTLGKKVQETDYRRRDS